MSYVALSIEPGPQKCNECGEQILPGEPVVVSLTHPSHARHSYIIEERGDRYLLKRIGHQSESYWLSKTPPKGERISRATEAHGAEEHDKWDVR
jgi:hypothetical protein